MIFLRRRVSRAEVVLCGLALALSAVAAAQLAATEEPSDSTYFLSALAVSLALGVTAGRTFRHWRASESVNDGWLWLFGGCVMAIGFAVSVIVLRLVQPVAPNDLEAGQPHLLSAIGITSFVLFGIGLLRLPWRPEAGMARMLAWFDGLLIAFAVLLIARQLFADPFALPVPELVRLLVRPPLMAALLVIVAFVIVSRAKEPGGLPIRELLPVATGAGLLGLAMALIYAPDQAPATQVLWMAPPAATLGALFIAIAASLDAVEQPGDRNLRAQSSLLAPVIPLAGAMSVVAWFMAIGRPLTPVATGLGVLLVVTVVVVAGVSRWHALSVTRTLELRVAERTLALGSRERWFRSLVQNSTDVITVVDRDGRISYQTPSSESVFGYAPGSLDGKGFEVLLRRDDVATVRGALADAAARPGETIRLQFPLRRVDGEWIDVETTVTSLLEEADVHGLVLNTRDVTERLRLEQELTHQAYSDALTGLANRTMFRRCVDEALHRSSGREDVAVVFLDLDGFKSVNDSRGHAAGDFLLTQVAVRLRNCVRPTDLIARLGGDEFAVLVSGERAEAGAIWIAERIQSALRNAFLVDGRELHVGASIGVTVNEVGDENADQMLRNADLAMYKAKAEERTTHVRFEIDMHRALVQRVQDENDLRQAMTRGELVLHYQPIIDLQANRVVGTEALVRWNHPERGLLGPNTFVELAEETGLIETLGAWVLNEACRQAGLWQVHANGHPFRMAVNVSARQLSADFVDLVRDAMAREGLPAGALTLELTESVLVDHAPDTMDVMTSLRSLGAQIAVDDFGTGYSSLSYLAQFPVDILKVDRAFVRHVGSESEQSELARTVVRLGESLNMVTVAEGIETEVQAQALRELGCPLGQGFLFARPTAADDVDFRTVTIASVRS